MVILTHVRFALFAQKEGDVLATSCTFHSAEISFAVWHLRSLIPTIDFGDQNDAVNASKQVITSAFLASSDVEFGQAASMPTTTKAFLKLHTSEERRSSVAVIF